MEVVPNPLAAAVQEMIDENTKLDFCRFLGISYEGRRISKDRTRADIRW
jgi:hypothetical protein